ncbi:neurogenic locus notch-like protein 1 [Trichonephila inaurata madagascariensis]|uniref:Neurogenic locus notch-like protein 1 n=1 Tax=Trichonephila inaurata madagascariensis TaxID=2747483 RepID=A0A8X7BW44_9ARAC|nr:neurogenic locus notch-like protein 1 [Trichonephila inaurata madagascariensis]
MIVVKVIAIFFFVSGVTCEDEISTTISIYEGNETNATSFENLTTSTVGSQIELTSETITSNQTDIDTSGDIIITSETENDTDSSTPTEGRSTETVITSTEPEEIITESDWSACSFNPCKNGGTCERNSAHPNTYECNCIQGYTGTHCQVLNSCVTVEKETCPLGACVYEEDGLSKSCACFFGMSWDDDLKECRDQDPPCFPNPCHNGTCILHETDFHCSCNSGYDGEFCAILNKCGKDDVCENGECVFNKLKNFKYCHCNSDFYWNENSEECEENIKPCLPNPCSNEGKCTPLDSGTFNCTCSEGYTGQSCSDNDYCVLKGGNYFCRDAQCKSVHSLQTYYCSCSSGQYFHYGTRTCIDIDFCPLMKCGENEECVNNTCDCKKNYKRDNSTGKCEEYIGNVTCTNKTCDRGVCLSTEGEEMCICPPGYEEVDAKCIDLCSADHLPEGYCPGNQCEPVDSGFRCKCEGKYTLSWDGITCTARRMCHEGETGWSMCSERHAECVDDWLTPEGFRCQCKQGQVESEGYCQDICDIEENQKRCSVLGAECDVSTIGKKTCKCPPFFQPFSNGTACDKSASFSYLLILPLNSASYKKKEVIDTRNRRSAEILFSPVDYDSVQRDVLKSLKNIFPELKHSNVLNCKDNENYLECKVEMQFTSITEEDLKRLTLPEVCHANAESPHTCLVPPSLLLRKDSLKTVVSAKRTDPCDEDIKEDLCGSETFCTSSDDKLSFKCRCEAGFTIRAIQYPFGDSESFIQSCKDIDECAMANPCSEHMECQNTLGSYTCSCLPGFRWTDAKNTETSDCVEICNPNPCVHGDCAKVGDHEFECRCAAGYNGILCDSQDESFKRARTNTIVVGAVLGGALLVVIILSITSISRIKKKKRMLEDSDRILYGTEMTERRGNGSGNVNNAYQRE